MEFYQLYVALVTPITLVARGGGGHTNLPQAFAQVYFNLESAAVGAGGHLYLRGISCSYRLKLMNKSATHSFKLLGERAVLSVRLDINYIWVKLFYSIRLILYSITLHFITKLTSNIIIQISRSTYG
jgi:hypothetical protein